jgi:hypothetical protein
MNEVAKPEPINIANGIIPTYTDGTKKAEYLSFRTSYFSVRESCQLAKVSEKQVRRWREADPTFNHLDTDGLTELRKQFSDNYIDMQFSRNFRLVMQKDFTILFKDATEPEKMTEAETRYLEKVRAHYTPQSLAMVKQILSGGTTEEPFNFTKEVMKLSIKREQIEIVEERSIAQG